MKFPSKKDWWLTIIVWGAMLFAFVSGVSAIIQNPANIGENIMTGLMTILLPAGIIWLWLSTYYVLTDKELIVRYGPFKKIVPLHSVKSVKKTMNPLSSPALSLKRLEIQYGQYSIVLISPKDRDEFMDILAKRCPQAKIKK